MLRSRDGWHRACSRLGMTKLSRVALARVLVVAPVAASSSASGTLPMIAALSAQTLARARILVPKVANAHCAD